MVWLSNHKCALTDSNQSDLHCAIRVTLKKNMGCSGYVGCSEILLGWFYIIRLMVNIFWSSVQPKIINFLKQTTTKNCPLTGGGIICIWKVQTF